MSGFIEALEYDITTIVVVGAIGLGASYYIYNHTEFGKYLKALFTVEEKIGETVLDGAGKAAEWMGDPTGRNTPNPNLLQTVFSYTPIGIAIDTGYQVKDDVNNGVLGQKIYQSVGPAVAEKAKEQSWTEIFINGLQGHV